jgi:hypothetical protein
MFKKGQSGNPAGRKTGTSEAAKLRRAIEADLPDIISAMSEAAKQGEVGAAKLLLDRSIPTIKPTATGVTMDDLKGTLSEQGDAIIAAMGDGTITPEQAQQMLAGLASLSKIRETDDLARRIEQLEAKQNDN